MPTGPYRSRIARTYKLPHKLSAGLALLLVHDTVTSKCVYDVLGETDHRSLMYRLRVVLRVKHPDIQIHSLRTIGYWLDDADRETIASECGIPWPLSSGAVKHLTGNVA